MSNSDPKSNMDDERFGDMVHAILQAVARAQFTPEEIARGDGYASSEDTIKALAITLAMVIEATTDASKPAQLREQAERIRKMVLTSMKQFREDYQRTGIHMHEHFGAARQSVN